MGYDLKQAGYQFNTEDSDENMQLLHTIAEDFIKAARLKAGVNCDKETILLRFKHTSPFIATQPVLILYIDAERKFDIKLINRSSRLFNHLFVEDLA